MAVHRCDVCNLFEYDEIEGHPPSRIEAWCQQALPNLAGSSLRKLHCSQRNQRTLMMGADPDPGGGGAIL